VSVTSNQLAEGSKRSISFNYDDSRMLMMTMMMTMRMTMVMASRGSKTMEMIMLVIKDLREWLKIFLT